jgi:hypothetical protein
MNAKYANNLKKMSCSHVRCKSLAAIVTDQAIVNEEGKLLKEMED